MLSINYSQKADRFLKSLNKGSVKFIIDKIKILATNPDDLKNNITKLKGYNLYRLKAGNFRIIYDSEGNILNIYTIGYRKDIYNSLPSMISRRKKC